MKKETISKLQKTFEDYVHETDGIEFWFARDLQSLLGYVEWRKFQGVIEKAKEACKNSGNSVSDHFVDAAKMVKIGSEAEREVEETIFIMKAKLFLIFLTIMVCGATSVLAETYDDFSGSTLDTSLWTETTQGTAFDEYGLDTSAQNYHTAQLSATGGDRESILEMTEEFSEGDAVSYDVTYQTGSGNIISRLYINEQYLDTILTEGSGSYATSGDIGYWNGDSEVGNTYGTYEVAVKFTSDGAIFDITRPDLSTWTGSATGISEPYSFGVATHTGHDGSGEFDYDNFDVTYPETEETTEEEDDLEDRVIALEATVEELEAELDEQQTLLDELEGDIEYMKIKLLQLWKLVKTILSKS